MQALRLNEVLTWVVAWHNRHPLARRISATQVHSIGEVLLPFASAQAAPAPPGPPALPPMRDLLDPAAARLAALPASADGLAVAAQPADDAEPAAAPGSAHAAHAAETAAQADPPDAPADASAEPAPVLSMDDEADDLFSTDPPPAGEPAAPPDDGPEILVELSSDPDGDLPADPQSHPETDQADGRPADPAAHPAASQPLALPADHPQPAAPQPQPAAASTPPAGLLARLGARLKGWHWGGTAGLPRLQATFSRDFIWPLRPGQVARWARRHGSVVPLAPADWPRRLIDTDGSLLAQARRQGLPHALPLHLLTAAIGVGDRRIRVLVDAQGHILGPRSYSPPKLAAVASLLAVGLVGGGWGWLPRADSLSAKQTRAVVAAAGSAAAQAAAQAAAAAELAAAAASAADRVWRAQQAGSMLASTAPADAPLAEAPPTETLLTVAPDTAHTAAPPAKPAPHGGQAEAWAHTAASAPRVTSAASTNSATAATPGADPSDPTVTPAQRQAALPLGILLPVLSAADKLAARQQVEAARKGQAAAIARQPPKPATPVFAIVTRPSREKSSAARGLALIRASGQRLAGELPEHRELMLNQGEWRAAWWPFESLADAERAQVMLAARGLKVEVVEF